MSWYEAIGEAVTGALTGRALEPTAGERPDGHTHETKCLNCGTRLSGEFCHGCGQHAHVHRTIGAFFHDLLHGVFHFEGKIWNTLPMLAWKPGELTRGYIDGQRARYVSPIALFLFAVFLMFAVFGLIGSGFDVGGLDQINRVDVQIKQRQADIQERGLERAKLVASGASTAAVDTRLREDRDDLQVLEIMRKNGVVEGALKSSNGEVTSKSDWLNRAYIDAKKNPTLLFYKLRTNAYKFSWILIPLSVPLMWLMFPFSRRFRGYDHTVFVTYSLAFMTMLTIVASAAALLHLRWLVFGLVVFVPVHMYRQLKGTYSLSRAGALWRTAVLVILAWVGLALFGLAILALGVAK